MASSITIENVNAAYGAVRVIEDVSINVKAGETVALLGTNGNGKSTLMKCVMGIVRPTAGRIVAEGRGESVVDEIRIGSARRDGNCGVVAPVACRL